MASIDKLPSTAWKHIVLTPPKEVEKYKYQVPEGKGNRSRGKISTTSFLLIPMVAMI
jgi:hypothetical protein